MNILQRNKPGNDKPVSGCISEGVLCMISFAGGVTAISTVVFLLLVFIVGGVDDVCRQLERDDE